MLLTNSAFLADRGGSVTAADVEFIEQNGVGPGVRLRTIDARV